VLQCLRSPGIPVIVLKGAYLAEAVYRDVALRPMCDVDLMVPRADLARAEAVLLDVGGVHRQFEGIESSNKWSSHLPKIVVRDLAVEIHWTIVSPVGPVRADIGGLWEMARPALTAGVEVLSLSPEDLLLHLCLHFCYRDGCTGLRSLCDIAETIHHFRGEMDWPQVVDRAREWGATRHVGLALHLAGSMLGAEVHDDVIERLIPEGIDQRMVEAAREAVLTQTGPDQWVPLFRRLGASSLGDKAKLLRERVFLSRGEMAATYPTSRDSRHFYLYYALRLRDGLRTYTSDALRRARLLMQRRRRERYAALYDWLTRP